MQYLRNNTACRITVGPFIDKTDGVTPETALTVTNCKLTMVVDDGNVPTIILDTNPTASGGTNDMVHITGDDAGFYDLELTAANVNYLGRARIALTDAANHCPVFHEFMIFPAMIYDSMILGTDRLDTNVTHAADTAWASGAIVAGVIASDTFTAAKFASDVATEFQSGLATAAELAKVPKSDSNVVWNATAAAQIQSEVTDAIVAASLDKLVLATGTADSGSTTTMVDAARTEADADYWKGRILLFTSGTIVGQCAIITDFNEGTDTFTFAPALTQAVGTQTYIILPSISVWDDTLTDHLTAGTTGNALNTASATLAAVGALPTAAVIADAVWDEDATAHQTQGTFGQAIGDPVADTNTIFKAVVTDAAGANVSVDVLDVKAETAAINAKTTNLPSDPADASVISERFDTVDANIAVIDDYIDTELTTILASVDTEVAAILVDTNELQTDWVNGGRLDLILDARASQMSVDELPTNAELATALGTADDAVLAQVALVKAKTDLIPSDPAETSDIPTAAVIADAVWDEALAGHVIAGSAGDTLSDAGSAGDPWNVDLPGAYGAGKAGKIIGDNINATVSSRASQTSVDDLPTNAELATALGTADDAVLAAIDDLPTNAELATALGTADDPVLAQIALVKAKTDLIPASPAAVGSAMTLEADAVNAAAIAASGVSEIQSGLATSAEVAVVDAIVDAIKLQTDLIPSDPADASVVAGLIAGVQTKVDELHLIEGLDAANPMTVTPSSREAGALELVLTGNGTTTKTVTRTP